MHDHAHRDAHSSPPISLEIQLFELDAQKSRTEDARTTKSYMYVRYRQEGRPGDFSPGQAGGEPGY